MKGFPFQRSCVLSLAGRTLSDWVLLRRFLQVEGGGGGGDDFVKDALNLGIIMTNLSCSGLNVMSRRWELVVFHSTNSRGHVLRFQTSASIRSGSVTRSATRGGREEEQLHNKRLKMEHFITFFFT